MEKPKTKHLVLSEELFNQFLNIQQNLNIKTQKEAISVILERFNELNDLTHYHNPADIAEIERLNLVKCDKVNCQVNSDLNELNAELTQKNTELNKLNEELSAKLNEFKQELNGFKSEFKQKETELSMAKDSFQKSFGNYNYLLLDFCAQKHSRETNRPTQPIELLRKMFEGYLNNDVYYFDKPNSRAKEVLKAKTLQIYGSLG